MIESLLISSDEKILPLKKPCVVEKKKTMAKDETISFQLAYRSDVFYRDLDIKIDSEIKEFITYRSVECVPCGMPSECTDGYYISEEKYFLCPDLLKPIGKCKPVARYNCWNSLWFTVKGNLSQGIYPVKISILYGKELMSSQIYTIEVLDFVLGKRSLIYTNWFHYDALAQYYSLPVFSEEYNKIMYNFIENAIRHGMNMLLIPMFTPPLDTRIGEERLTVQLIDVKLKNGKYDFDFSRLIDFMRTAKKLGIIYFEMSHLFTQWGAKAAPKIVAETDSGIKRIFGWDTFATSEEYVYFLKEFLPKLKNVLIEQDLYENCRFHISDEPNELIIDDYKAARSLFLDILPDAKVMDALSHYDFYKQGLVDSAVVATNAIQPFLDNNVPELWAYYCCVQSENYLSNRFMAMPGERTRIIGFQMYLNNIKGFLHWGYNFYNSALSDEPINPYLITDAGGSFPSGDAFIVYPGDNGAYDSIRHEQFFDAIQDYRLMCKLEETAGRECAERLLLDGGLHKNFTQYPHSIESIKKIREKAQRIIIEKEKR